MSHLNQFTYIKDICFAHNKKLPNGCNGNTGTAEDAGIECFETRAYIALLSLGTADANEISEKTRIPRGRIYDALNSLVENNLA